MAELYAFTKFNMKTFNLHDFFSNDPIFRDDVFWGSFPNIFEDMFFSDKNGDVLELWGSSFRVSDGNLIGGTVELLGNAYFSDQQDEWVWAFFIVDLNLSARDVWNAVKSPSQSDDQAILKKAFAGDDTFYLSNQKDTIIAYTGDDAVYGKGGNDNIDGGGGRDHLYGESGDDTVTGGDGRDILMGEDGEDWLRGEGQNDDLFGGNGFDRLLGQLGNDTLSGGKGRDAFIFDTSPRADNSDVITDFSVVADTIRLDDAVFTGLKTGALSGAAFVRNTSGNAQDRSDRIIYESDTGKLYFDRDGAGGSTKVHFATLDNNLSLTQADFFVF